MKFAQLVIGPAGCGKSTLCKFFQQHFAAMNRACKVVNLDPAADHFDYECSCDVRELVSVDDVMGETDLGPNGGLVHAMEFLVENLDWFEERMDGYVDDDFILFDCPGQIELFTHIPVMRTLVDTLQRNDFRVGAVFCLDTTFLADAPKFVGGILTALSAMLQLEVPHVNVLTKCDLVSDKAEIDAILERSPEDVMAQCRQAMPGRFRRLNEAMGALLEDYSLVSLVPFDVDDEDSVGAAVGVIESSIQYGEDLDTKAQFDMGGGEGA